ncbi:MAG: DUF475 domain-containing protein, partial [Burkholderiales bacterium]
MQHFKGSIAFTLVALALAGLNGYVQQHALAAVASAVFIAAVLGVMETSLSLDNAVVNATVLRDMDEKWVKRFLTWGIAIAVFGMRVVFPLVIVAIAAQVTPWEAVRIALFNHERYQSIVTGAHIGISGFGGAFLALVGLSFFFDQDREHLWISFIEKPLAAFARIPYAQYIATLLVVGALSLFVEHGEQKTFLLAAAAGIATYFGVEWLGEKMGAEDASGKIVRTGAASFVYLEFLDASFSFDGVIGAFAITNDIVQIALGLGIGAMFVRSMTVALVHGGTLGEYRFLEAGAFYAIIALAAIMLLSTVGVETPEVVTGLVGAAFIGASFWASARHRRRFPHEYTDGDDTDGDDTEMILP